MTHDEFIKAADRFHRWSVLACLLPLGGAVLCGLPFAALQDHIESAGASAFGEPAGEILRVLPIVAVVVLGVGSMVPFHRWIDRRFGVPCPHCGRPVAGHKSIVVASRNCPHCGSRILDSEIDES